VESQAVRACLNYRSLRRVFPLIALLLAALLWSPPAQAVESPGLRTATTSAPQAQFSLKADGHLISVEGSGRQVTLAVERDVRLTAYVTRGRSTPHGLRARFGRFGLISVRFKPSGKVRRNRPPERCEGKAAVARSGVFVGTIRFRGEDGYVDVDAERAKGSASTTPRWRCSRRPGPLARVSAMRDGSGLESAVLRAFTPNERVLFETAGLRDPKGPDLIFFLAGASERTGSVRIVRLTLQISERGRTFVFDRPLRSATVDPPKPFHGSASFQRTAGVGPTWSGSLEVSLLGAPNLPLTGPSFTPRLFRP
jgi:hypothetical protein